MQNAGIFGATLCGKTTLAKHWVTIFAGKGYESLVLDINPSGEVWPSNAHVYSDEGRYWETVWKSRNCLVIVDEASTVLHRDAEKQPLFTRIRHFGHRLIVIGHSYTDLLPPQRQQLEWLFLFRQTVEDAKRWSNLFVDERILTASNLEQYQFLWATLRPRNVLIGRLSINTSINQVAKKR